MQNASGYRQNPGVNLQLPSKVVIFEPRWVEYFRQDISRSPTLTMRIGGREPRSLLVIDTKLGRLQDPGSYTVLLETSFAGARI